MEQSPYYIAICDVSPGSVNCDISLRRNRFHETGGSRFTPSGKARDAGRGRVTLP